MKKIIIGLAATMLACACTEDPDNGYQPRTDSTTDNTTTTTLSFVKGADLSWVTEMEDSGIKFYDSEGTETDCFELMQQLGVNAVRFRVWVNPTGGYCNKNDVIVKAYRANKLGLPIMIDFHYSDTWADPSDQTKPAAWEDLSFDDLCTAVADHTTDVLTSLQSLGIDVEWVQIGNETGGGMLWDDGKIANGAQYTALHNAGAKAARAVFPDAKIVIHVQNAYRLATVNYVCQQLAANDGDYDIIGLSHYPEYAIEETAAINAGITDWQGCNEAAAENMTTLASRYSKDVMIVEFGYSSSLPDEGYECLSDLITRCKAIPQCLGVMYWEPECYNGWNSYGKGAFDENGQPTAIMDAFAD